MGEGYLQIQQEYLNQAWSGGIEVLEEVLPAKREVSCVRFKAFGEDCEFCPQQRIDDRWRRLRR